MASAAPSLIGRLWSFGLDYALPPRCPGGGAIVDGDHRFCATCWQALEFLGPPACARCALPLPHDPGRPDALIAAVPLHRWRLWSRGYNQALLIARALAERSGHACLPDAIVRTRATPVLRGLGRKARTEAVRGAFAVPPPHKASVKGRTILLVDAVFTSGATAEACAKALHKAGAAEVWLVCWARVVRADDGVRR